MELHFSFDNLPEIQNPVVTTGSFDGVHIGHKAIINRLVKLANDINGKTVLITFYPHPRRVLYPDTEGKDLLMILSQNEKIELLRKTGLDHLIIIHFTPEFAKISSHDFVENILAGKLQSRIVVVGFNHHFGHNREGNFNYLYNLSRQYNFDVEEIPEQDIQNESVSSTKIRKALLEGNIQRANAYLDHYYIIKGEMVTDYELSRLLASDIYSLQVDENTKLVPPDGVYAVNVEIERTFSKGMVWISNWGVINNILSPDLRIQLNIFNYDKDPQDKNVTIYFQKKIRDALFFNETEELKKQMQKDQAEIEDLIY